MAINTIQFATLLQQKLDEQITAHSTTGWMEANAGQVKYSGGKEIKVPGITTSGLADYDRDSGFVQGAVNFGYETLTMSQDRGRTLREKCLADGVQCPFCGRRLSAHTTSIHRSVSARFMRKRALRERIRRITHWAEMTLRQIYTNR